jgi:hypothetical protein
MKVPSQVRSIPRIAADRPAATRLPGKVGILPQGCPPGWNGPCQAGGCLDWCCPPGTGCGGCNMATDHGMCEFSGGHNVLATSNIRP